MTHTKTIQTILWKHISQKIYNTKYITLGITTFREILGWVHMNHKTLFKSTMIKVSFYFAISNLLSMNIRYQEIYLLTLKIFKKGINLSTIEKVRELNHKKYKSSIALLWQT